MCKYASTWPEKALRLEIELLEPAPFSDRGRVGRVLHEAL